MRFDDIPEDDAQSFECPACAPEICSTVTKNEIGIWECDTCDFYRCEDQPRSEA